MTEFVENIASKHIAFLFKSFLYFLFFVFFFCLFCNIFLSSVTADVWVKQQQREKLLIHDQKNNRI